MQWHSKQSQLFNSKWSGGPIAKASSSAILCLCHLQNCGINQTIKRTFQRLLPKQMWVLSWWHPLNGKSIGLQMPSPLFFGAVPTFSCPTFASKHNLEFEQNHQFASKHELSSISYLLMFRNRRISFWKLPHSGKIRGNSSSFRQNFNSDVKQGSV